MVNISFETLAVIIRLNSITFCRQWKKGEHETGKNEAMRKDASDFLLCFTIFLLRNR